MRLDGGFLKERFAVSTPSQCERSVATWASDFAEVTPEEKCVGCEYVSEGEVGGCS